jgi:mRNA interferase MazF
MQRLPQTCQTFDAVKLLAAANPANWPNQEHPVNLIPGAVVIVDFGLGEGREQQGLRPAVVISSVEYLGLFPELVGVVPATTKDRGWPSHVALTGKTGLKKPTFALTEQYMTISLKRVKRISGVIDRATQRQVSDWLAIWQER